MALARILKDHQFDDVIMRGQVSDVFLFFLPGIASGLKKIALEDVKIGHRVPMVNFYYFNYKIFILIIIKFVS